jgi:hypothetical protein
MTQQVITTGTDLIRVHLVGYGKKANLGALAKDLSIPSDALDLFARGKGRLAPEALKVLTRFLWAGAAEYDPAVDLLRSTNKQEPRALGLRPPSVSEQVEAGSLSLPTFPGGPPSLYPASSKAPAPRKARPGWA